MEDLEDYLEDVLEDMAQDTRVQIDLDSATIFNYTSEKKFTRQDSCGIHEAAVWLKTIEQLKCEGRLIVRTVQELDDRTIITLELYRNGFLENFATLANEVAQAEFYNKLEIVEI